MIYYDEKKGWVMSYYYIFLTNKMMQQKKNVFANFTVYSICSFTNTECRSMVMANPANA